MQYFQHAGTIWTLNLDEAITELMPNVTATMRRVGLDSEDELAVAMGSSDVTEVHQRFENGRRCYAAWVGGSLASYGWVSFNEETIGELDIRLNLKPGEAYIWNCVTLPAFRQKYLYSALLVYIVRELQKEQISRAWIGTEAENIPSQRGIARAGFVYVGDLFFLQVLRSQHAWVQGRANMPRRLVGEAQRAFLNRGDTPMWLRAVSFLQRLREYQIPTK